MHREPRLVTRTCGLLGDLDQTELRGDALRGAVAPARTYNVVDLGQQRAQRLGDAGWPRTRELELA